MCKWQKGLTLIEVMVALGIFAILLTGAALVLYPTMSANKQAQAMTAAVTTARDKIEELREGPLSGGGDTIAQPGSGDVSRTWTVGGGPTATTNTITVTVSWTDSETHQVQLQTVIRP